MCKMASAEFLEEALSTDVDQNVVNAIVGSLENHVVPPATSASSNNSVVSVIPSQYSSLIKNTGLISAQKNVINGQNSVNGIHTFGSFNGGGSFNNVQEASFPSAALSNNLDLCNISSQNRTLGDRVTSGQSLPNGCLQSQIKLAMQPPLVLKQGSNPGQVGMQSGMMTVPMTVNSSMPGSISNVMTINKPGQNVVVTTQNLGSAQAQPTIIPNVQILNMRPSAPAVAAQKSVATVSPRVVIGTPQVVGTRAAAPGITLQTLQSLQPGQQGHLLLKTENGQYQLLRVGPAPAASTLTAPQPQTIRLSTVPAHPGVATASTSMAAPGPMQGQMTGPMQGQLSGPMQGQMSGPMQGQMPGPMPGSLSGPMPGSLSGTMPGSLSGPMPGSLSGPMPGSLSGPMPGSLSGPIPGQMPAAPMATPVIPASMSSVPSVTPPPLPPSPQHNVTNLKPSDNTKEKCRNFLANLLDLSSKEPPSVERNVRNLIQELIDALVEPEEFCDRLEKLLNASPQPCLIGFLKKSLPLLRQSLVTKELIIEGIIPPAPHIAFSNIPAPVQPVMTTSNMQMKPPAKSNTIAVLQNIPVQTKINVGKMNNGKGMAVYGKNFQRGTISNAGLSTVLTPGKPMKEKEKKSQFTSQPFVDDKMAGDDDINDVAAMGGVNLAEESQRILGSTEMIGTQIRSCKEEYLVPMSVMQARVRSAMAKHNMEEPAPEVSALLIHAVHERLKNLVEKLAVIAQHRIDLLVKTDSRYEQTQDVKGQLKFLEELDMVDKKRREDSERELLLRAAKSRSKNEDPEQAKLKAKAKEMQRAELEEMRQREANLTALQAIGPRKKARLEALAGSGDSSSNGSGNSNSGISGRSQLALRTRLKRINLRDMLFLMEQEPETSHSLLLYKSYLK